MTSSTSHDLSSSDLEQPRPRTGPGMLQVAWERKSLLVLGVVVGVVLGALWYAQKQPVYQTNAQVLVIKKRPDALPVSGGEARMSYFEDYLSTHVALVRSPLIIERAVSQHGLKNLRSLAEESEPVQTIIKALTVGRDRDSTTVNSNNILNLSFRATANDECATVLNAVIQSYKDFLDETYRNVSDDTLKLITQARDVLEKELAEKEAAFLELRKQGPLLARNKDGVTAQQARLADIEAKRAGLQLRRAEIEARQATIESVKKSNRGSAALAALITEWSNKNGLDRSTTDAGRRKPTGDLEDQLVQLQLQELTLEQDYGPAYPQLVTVRKRIDFLRNTIARQRAGKGTLSEEDDPRLLASVEVYNEALKQELEDLIRSDKALGELLEREGQHARQLTNFELEEAKLASEITRKKEQYDGIIRRLKEIGFVKDYGGYDARILAPAGVGLKVEPRLFTTLSVSLLLGLLGGLGLTYLAELSDKSFRTADEVRRRLGLPVIGHVPQFVRSADVAAESALDASLCTVHDSLSAEAEAYRSVRTALYFNARGKGHKVFQVTSPDPGDGKSTLTANLAVSMAQSNKRVLLIDADFRRPRQHQVFGLTPHTGLSAVLAGDAMLSDAIQESGVPGLSVLPCGPIPPNPAELLTSLQFQEFLEAMREQYDLILVDTPPLLAVTDPAVVAPRVDGVVLTLRLSKNGRPRAERAREILQTLGANVLGVVINGIARREGGGYGYQQYDYSYSAHYRADETPSTNGDAHHAPELVGAHAAAIAAKPSRNGRHHPRPPRFWHRLFNL